MRLVLFICLISIIGIQHTKGDNRKVIRTLFKSFFGRFPIEGTRYDFYFPSYIWRPLKSLNYLFLCVLKLLKATISNINIQICLSQHFLFSQISSLYWKHRLSKFYYEFLVSPGATYATKLEVYKASKEKDKKENWIKRPIYIAWE